MWLVRLEAGTSDERGLELLAAGLRGALLLTDAPLPFRDGFGFGSLKWDEAGNIPVQAWSARRAWHCGVHLDQAQTPAVFAAHSVRAIDNGAHGIDFALNGHSIRPFPHIGRELGIDAEHALSWVKLPHDAGSACPAVGLVGPNFSGFLRSDSLMG